MRSGVAGMTKAALLAAGLGIFTSPASADIIVMKTPKAAASFNAQVPVLKLAYRHGEGPGAVTGAEIVTDETAADLVYDVAARTVEKRMAGIVAESVAPSGLAGIVAKWRALALLRIQAAGSVEPFEVEGGSRTYRRGEKLKVDLSASTHRFMTVFNLPPDGRVEFLYPKTAAERDKDWRGKRFTMPLLVREPPFGAEHLVALVSDQPLDDLHEALRELTQPEAAAALPGVLKNGLGDKAVALGIANIFTTGDNR